MKFTNLEITSRPACKHRSNAILPPAVGLNTVVYHPHITTLSRFRVIVKSNTNGSPVMSIVLSDNLLTMQLPQSRVVIRASSYQVRRVGTESAVPYPALVTGEGGLQGIRLGFLVRSGFDVLNFPNLGCVVCAAGRELLDIRGQQNASDVFLVGVEVSDRHKLCSVETLYEIPYEYVALAKWLEMGHGYLCCYLQHYWRRIAESHRWLR
jgi:hypothetical protein